MKRVAARHRRRPCAPACTGIGRTGRAAESERQRADAVASAGRTPADSTSSGARRRAERVDDRAAQHLVDERLIEEAHFRLRRMDVDVHAIGRQLDEQVHFRAALLDRRDAVGLLNRVRDRAVATIAAVDEDVLRPAHGSLLAERGDEAAIRDAGRRPS